MYVLVLPVSGGGFVSQLGIIQHLCESNIIPDITFASSGGNVAAYVASASKWHWAAIERTAHNLSNDLFVSNWNSTTSLSMIIGYFKTNVYNKGIGVRDLLTKYFDHSDITKDEIWTGTYNKNKQKARLFCNKKREDCILDTSNMDHDLTQTMEAVFADGDIDLIAKYSVASASIPALVPPSIIFEEEYVDGGMATASPLTIMQEPILKHIRKNDTPLHIIYVNSLDLSSPRSNAINNVLDTWRQATINLIRSQTVVDRLAGYELLRCNPGTMNREEFLCNYDNMQRVKEIHNKVKYSMLEIYPVGNYDIDISSFTGDDVINGIKASYADCKCRLWWIGEEDTEISSLLDSCKQ